MTELAATSAEMREYADRLRAPYCGPEAAAESRDWFAGGERRSRSPTCRCAPTRRSACLRWRAKIAHRFHAGHGHRLPASARGARQRRDRPVPAGVRSADADDRDARSCGTFNGERGVVRRVRGASRPRARAHARRIPSRCPAAARDGRRDGAGAAFARAADALHRHVAWPRPVGAQPRADAFGVARVLPFPDRARPHAEGRPMRRHQGAQVAAAAACRAVAR